MDRDMTNSKFQASAMPIKQRIQQIDVSIFSFLLGYYWQLTLYLCVTVEHQGRNQNFER